LKKTLYIIAILIFCCFAFWFCNKRPFAHIEITGQVVNFWTKAPVSTGIKLWVGGSSPGSKGTTYFGSYATNADGTFDIKSNAEWNGDDYMLEGDSFSYINCTVPKHKIVDVGDILTTGSIVLNCKVNLNSVSGASITLFGESGPQTFSAGTNTLVTTNSVYFSYDYPTIGNFCPITYSLSTSTTYSFIQVPIQPPAVTTSVTINY
jgi:hypothetical protein